MLAHKTSLPVYRQIANQIAEEIKAGTRPPNSRIPSERELAERFGISRMTARAAINLLMQRGLVSRRSRAGVFVAQPKVRFDLSSPHGLHQQLQKAGITPGAKIITAEVMPAHALDSRIVQALALHDGEKVYHIVRLRTANDEPIALENSFFPVRLFPDLLDFNLTDSIYGILKKYFGVEPAQSFQELEISLLDEEWAEIMGVHMDLPILEIRRCAMTEDGTPFEYAHDIYRGDRIIFTARTVKAGASSVGQIPQDAWNHLRPCS
ncbi:MAG: GntR family transcriptional regulator [Chloroflexi bacterium]|nr:GntR family transcriptional regulator [Chloroflexota bacterium]